MPERTCYHCAFGVRPSATRIYTAMMACWSALMTCVNHPDSPGVQRDVAPTSTCVNFRARRKQPVRLEPPAPPNDRVRYIALTRGKFAMVDAADYEWLSQYKWSATSSGLNTYACRNVRGKIVLMHRFIMKAPKGMVVDHIDGNGLNNCRSNLRICTHSQNMCNSRIRSGSSQYKGVCYERRSGRWVAHIACEGQSYHLGTFDSEIEAARAYDRKAIELFGQFARLNFPEEHAAPI